ncbi:MAG TPA: TAXI family TRAP transporter solute-binding subunit [Stellaceae bacterium]|nr:TAXI family TRAP transporter solute-binding subunit [Stellaceae bacterium]
MSSSPWRTAALVAALAAVPLGFAPAAAAQTAFDHVNRGVVELETATADGISPKIANDLADLVDDGATRRVLPVLGEGSLQNLVDLKRLRGIDLAIVQADVLDYVRAHKLQPGVETLPYVTRLYNEEFHLLARRGVNSVAELQGKKVNVDVPGAGTGITAAKIFGLLGIAIDPTTDSTSLALAKLERGQIDAVAYVGGAPAPVFRTIDAASGLHFLAIPLQPAITAAYAPTRLDAKEYPGLVPPDGPVDTVAVGAVLMAANLAPQSERYRNVANFVDTFFTQFSSLLTPGHHPKWREVNLAAELPGWHRFAPAAEWLARNAAVAQQPASNDMRVVFERFLDERLRLTGNTAMTQQQKDALFSAFRQWQSSQAP